jgi:hypothetical protein
VKDRPALAQLLELAANAMELGDGVQRLELVFVDGRLRSWSTTGEELPAYKLARFDRSINWRAFSVSRPG